MVAERFQIRLMEQEDEESIDDNASLPDLLDDPHDNVINDPLEGTYFVIFCFIWNTSRDTTNNISLGLNPNLENHVLFFFCVFFWIKC